MSGSGISWAISKSAPCSRQITMPAPHHSVFLQAGCSSCRPTNSVKALKANCAQLKVKEKVKQFVEVKYHRFWPPFSGQLGLAVCCMILFLHLFQTKPLKMVDFSFLHAVCPSCHTVSSVKALKRSSAFTAKKLKFMLTVPK